MRFNTNNRYNSIMLLASIVASHISITVPFIPNTVPKAVFNAVPNTTSMFVLDMDIVE